MLSSARRNFALLRSQVALGWGAGFRRAFCVTSILATAGLSGCEVSLTRDVQPIVLYLEGSAVAHRDNSGSRRELAVESLLTLPESLQTAPDTHVDVALLPGALLNLEGDAEVRLDTAKITKNGNRVDDAIRREVHFTVARGTAVVAVQFESEGAGVAVATPHGILSIPSPALTRIEVRDGATRITCARGSVRFQPAGTAVAVVLEARSFREWPSSGEPVPADFDIRATEEIEKSLEVEQKLLGLEHRRRLSAYPWRP